MRAEAITLAVCTLAALAITLYVTLTPGTQYAWDGAAIGAWIATAWQVTRVIP